MARKRKKLGELLVEWGTVTDQQINQAVGIATGSAKRLGETLVEASFCKEEDVAKALAAQFDMEFVNLELAEVQSQIDMKAIPETSSRSTSCFRWDR